jgi:hypothetical protein
MSDWQDPNDDDEDYFSETLDGAELTGLEPKFVKVESMDRTPDELTKLNVSDLVKMYRDSRDQLATDRKGWKTREARIKTHMSIISMLLRDRGDQLGVDSFATPNGTAFRNLKEKFTITDWTSFWEYVRSTNQGHLVQKRVSPLAVKAVREEEKALPPGLESMIEVEFSVRAPTARGK